MQVPDFDPASLTPALYDQAPVAITLLGLDGRVLFYNDHAPRILDRRPEYLGRDVCELHNPASVKKIRAMLSDYADGGRQEYAWRLRREDKEYAVRLRPLLSDGQVIGAVHAVMLLP